MRALMCHEWCAFEDLRIEDVPAPPMRPGGVRIAVAFASIGFATSLVVAGKYQRKPPRPFAPGTEVAGVVTEVAPDVTRFRPGDRVAAILDWGGHAEEAVAGEDTTYAVPDGVDLGTSLHLPLSYGTAYGALKWRAALAPGETLLVHGAAGGVGLAAVELGKRFGATVLGVASTAEKRAVATAHGADAALAPEDFREAVKDLTGGRGADVVFDPVGGDMFDQSLRCVAQEGRILVIGFAGGRVQQIPANILLVKNVAAQGFNFGTYVGWGLVDERKRHAPRMQAMMAELFAWTLDGDLKPTVSHTFDFADYAAAMDMLLSRRATGKVTLRIGG